MRKLIYALLALVAVAALLAPASASPPPPQANRRFEVFNTLTAANTDIIASDFTVFGPYDRSARLRISVAVVTTNSVLNLQINSGGVAINPDLNDGTALTAGRLYKFEVPISSTYSYNLQLETLTTTGYLLVEELED